MASTRDSVYNRMVRGLSGAVLSDLRPPNPPFVPGFADVLVKNVRHLGSYSWTDDIEPTVLVPGSPRIWTDRAVPFPLPLSSAAPSTDKWRAHDARGPFGFAPLFAALDAQHARVAWPEIDVLVDRATLRKLLAWLSRSAYGRTFRLDLLPVGERGMLLNRWEEADAWDGQADDFCGMKTVVRYEVDACVPADDVQTPENAFRPIPDDSSASTTVFDTPGQPSGTHIKVVRTGAGVPQDALVELKSLQMASSGVWWTAVLPQMYLSATPHLYVGLHTQGAVVRVEKHIVDDKTVFETQPRLAERLRQLGQLLRTLRHLAQTVGRVVPLSVVGHKGELRLYERLSEEGMWVLPEEEQKRFVKDSKETTNP
ncbi:hypothetical protein K488DRAFT_69827 [Vararia minispora EC-137]|uniref:Uncharacterized protein n=1 Tax=Vararia minispora EC-137 TaxID=1314806 RepID=A0ACB8QP99_9AGAM|nr:hypothetical protein K488DRAFT_69827 [Vararia minispora EC-137]